MELSEERKIQIEQEEKYRSDVRNKIDQGHNQSNNTTVKSKKKIGCFGYLLIIIVIWIVLLIKYVNSGVNKPVQKNTNFNITPSSQSLNLGDQGYLRIPNTTDPETPIFLATDKKVFKELGKALLAKDMYGVLELAQQGTVFGVSNGTQVKVVDMDTFSRKVRIIKGVRPIDEDKVGLSGWAPVEWVTSN
ncbi:hypothetical protein HY612_03640 [Candidatus Roizmanbacteria bacterium]|nr:hypothetical protein [Candidatus Roizmanbacteria bacterium]